MFRLANFFKRRSISPKAEQTRKLALEPLEKRELLAVSYFDAATGAALHHQDTISLTSYVADASGQPQAPAYGETVFRRVTLKNTGDDLIDITSVALNVIVLKRFDRLGGAYD